ncbi:MAG TPA: HIT family protein [Patescibacteria group bacterium]|nr:HIT family protein [Patescibacteria group bacterium]
MADSECLFCKIVAGEIPTEKVYEDGEVLAFLDLRPKAPGHALVISKTHTPDLMNTSDEMLAQMMPKVKLIAKKLMDEYGAAGFNFSANNGPSAGQEIMHLHFHIIPRK